MDKVADQLARIVELDNGHARKKVVIIGAGMAGLSAAYELSKLGHTVTVLEATNRVGGRVRTHRFTSTGEYHELGAMRIPKSHDYTRHYIGEVGLDPALRTFVTSHVNQNCFYYFGGRVCRIKDAPASVFDRFHLSAHEQQIAYQHPGRARALLGLLLENTLKSLNDEDRASLFGEQLLTDRAAALEQQTLGDFLSRRLETADARELVGSVTGLEVWWEMALPMILRDEIVDTSTGLQEIAGGMDLLPTKLAAKLPNGTIRYNIEVLSIRLAGDEIHLRTRPTKSPGADETDWDCPPTNKPPQDEKADFVICTIPFGVLREVELEGLSAQKMRAIRNLNYASSTKVLLHCRERFWELGAPDERIIGGASHTDLITRATYYPSDHAATSPTTFAGRTGREGFRSIYTDFALGAVPINSTKEASPGPGVLVGSYNWGRDARRLGALPPNERATTVINVIRNFHQDIDKYVDDECSMYWDDFRWSRGAFCFMHPGDLRDYYHAAIRPEGRLHFAGEHCSLDQGWMQGAVMSGLRAVEEVVGR
ncbi:FAD-dependent oxidoreductase [Sinorhizobium medicae]|nr:FAD-dependent oxidoreductase [Sinorhizobium medicae]